MLWYLYYYCQYANLETSSMGAYFHAKNSKGSKMTYCQTDYSESRFDSENDAFSFNSRTTEGNI